MPRSSRLPALFFTLVLLAVAFPLALRAWRLQLLFLDAGVRSAARSTLEAVTAERGWLLSDVRLEKADASSLLFLYRDHRRTAVQDRCFVVRLRSTRLIPCES
ncbi:MAG: hypothetical protein PHW10_03250 [Candidatus Peribacteraceae bacterium]|nr:hypothetical protein [Candidatus Peribacteraceae bacterium]